mgnify:CR=1 FL=1
MKHLFSFVIAAFIGVATTNAITAQTVAAAEEISDNLAETAPFLDAFDVNLGDFLWQKRVLVVFADTPADPRLAEQIEYFTDAKAATDERDLILIVDSDPAAKSDVRRKLRPRGFSFVLIDKDGRTILRKAAPWKMRELGRLIDKTTIRQQEIRKSREE